MKEIIALQEYSDKYISLYEGEVRNIGNEIADRLIEEGIVAEHSNKSNSSEDLFIVGFKWQYDSELDDTKLTCDKTFDEIKSFFAEYYNFETDIFTKKIIGYITGGFSVNIGYNNSETGQLIKTAFYFMNPSQVNTVSFKIITIDNNGIYQKTYMYKDAGLPEEGLK